MHILINLIDPGEPDLYDKDCYSIEELREKIIEDLPLILNRKDFHSFDELQHKIENVLKIKLPKEYFSENRDFINKSSEFIDAPNHVTNICLIYQKEYSHVSLSDLKEKIRIKNPEINFFIWAVLNDRIEIAIILLSLVQNQLAFCLIGSIILKKLSQVNNQKDSQRFREASE
jgi:hypothetical protein